MSIDIYMSPENQQRVFACQFPACDICFTHFILDYLARSRTAQGSHYSLRHNIHLQKRTQENHPEIAELQTTSHSLLCRTPGKAES